MRVLNYQYQCHKLPNDVAAVIDNELVLRHRYYNKTIEVIRRKHDRVQAAKEEHHSSLSAAQACVGYVSSIRGHLRSALKKSRAHGAEAVDRKSITIVINRCTDTINSLKKIVAVIKSQVNQPYIDALASIDDQYAEEMKEIYAAAEDLHWGTKNAVRRSAEAAAKLSFRNTGQPPGFRSMNQPHARDGSIVRQIADKPSVDKVYGCTDQWIRIDCDNGRKLPDLWFRSGSDDKKKPIWLVLPIYHHRTLPTGSQVVGVTITRRQGSQHRMSDGTWKYRDTYYVTLTLNLPDRDESERPSTGVVAVDLGWRLRPEGLRVAYAIGDDGRHHELILPNDLINRMFEVIEIQKQRDSEFNDILSAVVDYLRPADEDRPVRIQAAAKHIHLWKSKSRLANFVDKWLRHPGDETLYPRLLAWRVKDTKQYNEGTGISGRIERRRLDIFRKWVYMLTNQYRTVVCEDVDWAQLRRLLPPEVDQTFIPKVYRNIGAPGEAQQLLKNAAASYALLSSYKTTIECHHCGFGEPWDKARLIHRCESCGHEWDQDENAARNLLRRYSEGSGASENTGPTRNSQAHNRSGDTAQTGSRKAKWSKRHKDHSEV